MNNPNISDSATVLTGAIITGDVTIQDGANIWYNSVLRADHGPVTIGKNTNIQDGCILHAETPLTLGHDVTVGHGCILHGCTIGDSTVVGMGSTVLDGAKIGSNCIIGGGSLVTGTADIPDGSLAFGRPAKVVRPLTPEEVEHNQKSAQEYLEYAKQATQSVIVVGR